MEQVNCSNFVELNPYSHLRNYVHKSLRFINRIYNTKSLIRDNQEITLLLCRDDIFFSTWHLSIGDLKR